VVKLRIMGTPNDIKWFVKLIHRHKKIKVNCTSDNLPVKGSKDNYRYYKNHIKIICCNLPKTHFNL
jgi:hypothetical protein